MSNLWSTFSRNAVGLGDSSRIEESVLPHVVKFSGGRSSAAMLLSLTRQGLLKPERGDVVLFANTSAEHPATYEFARKVCDEVETTAGVPCFWYEYVTYEKRWGKRWIRSRHYQLVHRTPKSEYDMISQPGYSHNGEVFEQVLSKKMMVPSRQTRFCTQELKIVPGIKLLAEWLAGGYGAAAVGGDTKCRTSAHEHSLRYKGHQYTPAEVEEKSRAAFEQWPMRWMQPWHSFTKVWLDRPETFPEPADLWGRQGPPVQYVSLLGLRADEPKRVRKYYMDTIEADCKSYSQPKGERVLCPLYDGGVDKAEVNDFWAMQDYDLEMEHEWGNCVYCPMKNQRKLRELIAVEPVDAVGPARFDWWIEMEEKYGNAGKTDGRFGFLTAKYGTTYRSLLEDTDLELDEADAVPCHCTD